MKPCPYVNADASHPLGGFDAEQFECQRERALDEVNEVKQESLARGVGLVQNVVVMVEIVKCLRQAADFLSPLVIRIVKACGTLGN